LSCSEVFPEGLCSTFVQPSCRDKDSHKQLHRTAQLFTNMIIKLTSDRQIIEIELDNDCNIFELTNAFRAMALAQSYQIDSINEAMPPNDY